MARTVELCGFDHAFGDLTHELLHKEQTHRSCDVRQRDSPVCIDHAHTSHNDVLYDVGYRGSEQKGNFNDLVHSLYARSLDLRQYVSCGR